MRVAWIVTGGVDESGREKVTPSLLSLVERLARSHDITVYVLRYHTQPRTYPLLGATVRDLGRPEGFLRQHHTLKRAIEQDGPFDVVHGFMGLPTGLAAATVAWRLNIPSIVTLDSGEFVSLPDIGYGLQRRWRQRGAVALTCRLASRVTVTSRYQERLAREHGVVPDVVALGVDTHLFTPAARTEGPPWRLVHVASLNAVKDQTTLVEAMRLVRQRVERVHLDMIGEDTLGGLIQKQVERAGLGSHVTFHGFLPSASVVPFYQRAHLAVLSSRHEAASVVVLEAAACGLATVGTRVGYLSDWAPHASVVVAPGDSGGLANAIVALLGDRERRDHIALAARAWTLEHGADWSAHSFDGLYRDLLVSRGRSGSS